MRSRTALSILLLLLTVFITACGNGGADTDDFIVTFYNGSEVHYAVSTGQNEKICFPADPEKPGYSFGGWYLDNGVWEIPFTTNSLFDQPITSHIDVYAKWTELPPVPVPHTHTEGEPTRENEVPATCKLEGSYDTVIRCTECKEELARTTTKTDKIDTHTYIGGICTVCGAKTDESFTVSFNSLGGSAVSGQTVKYGECATAPVSPSKSGYAFLGWYLGDDPWSFSTAVTDNITLTAKWEATVYTVTYIDMDKTTEITGLSHTAYTVLDDDFSFPTPTKLHYNFLGWYLDAECTERCLGVTKGSVGNITVYAEFAPKNYAITYVLVGLEAENSPNNPESYNVNTELPIELAEPTLEGYDFLGWYLDANYTLPVSSITEISGYVTVYAKWAEKPAPANSRSITYMDGDNPIIGLNPYHYIVGAGTAGLPTPTKEHYRFDGWYTAPEFTLGSKIERISEIATDDIVLYAKFTQITYSIDYSLGGGVNHPDNELLTSYTVPDTTAFKNPTKTGFTFSGWFTDPYFKNKIDSLEGQSGDLVLYAKWTSSTGTGVMTPEHIFGGG